MANVVKTIVKTDDEVNLEPIKKKYNDFTDGLAKDLENAGKRAGDKFTTGIAAGMEKASAKVVKANKDQEKAIKSLEIAQAKLTEVQENGNAKLSARLSAQKAYAEALERVQEATNGVADAERELNEERSNLSSGGTTTQTVDFDVKSSLSRIRGQVISELKSAGIQGGTAFAGALAAGMSPAAAAGLFVGIAAMAQSTNQQVRAKFSDMWDGVKQGAQEASAETADEFIRLAESLGRTFNAIKPQLQDAMAAGAPLIDSFGDGIDRLAKTAMPGLVAATKEFGKTGQSVSSLMESAGRSISNFFMESKEGAKAGGQAMEAFGRIIERMGSFAGHAVASLANMSGDVVPQLENAVNSAASAAENFIDTIGPSLASGASMGLAGLSALLQLVNGIITVLGPAAPAILNFATGLKVLDMITFGGVKGQWDSFMGSIRSAEGAGAKAKAGISGMLTVLGPVGIAAGVLTLGLGFLADQQAEAAQRAEKHRGAIKNLASEFERTGGAVDANIRKMVGERIVNDFKDAKVAADGLNVGLGYLTEAALKQGPAYDELHKKLVDMVAAGKELQTVDPASGAQGEVYTEQAAKAQVLLTALEALGGETDSARGRQAELASAMGIASGRINTLAEEFGILGDKSKTAAEKADALYQVMRRMGGAAPDIEEATRAWEELIDKFNTKEMDFESKAAGTQKWADSMVNARGEINLTTEDGRKLYDTANDMARAFAETATAMHANGESADAIRGRLQKMREDFIALADKMGFTRDQAIAMADKMGLIPDVERTVSTNLAPEIQKALDLGGKIRSLPNGAFSVTSNTQNAQHQLDSFVQTNDGRVIHIRTTMSGVSTNATNGGMKWQASGGPMRAGASAATGGARSGVVMANERGLQESIVLPNRTEMAIPITAPVGSQINPNAGNDFLRQGMRVPIIAEVTVMGDGSDVSQAIGYLVRTFVKFKGGDVQKALGQ